MYAMQRSQTHVSQYARTQLPAASHDRCLSVRAVTDDVRRSIAERTGNQWWAERLVPLLPGDREMLPRARTLQNSILRQWDSSAPVSQVTFHALPYNPKRIGDDRQPALYCFIAR